MSRTVTDTFTGNITAYDTTDHNYYSVSNMSRGYTESSSTTYATINDARGANAETYVYWLFDTSSIPNGATIDSVTIKAKIYASGSTGNHPIKEVQAFTGTTAKGTASNMTTTAREVTLSIGTWTLAELRNARIRVYDKRANNTTTDGAIRFYGGTITVSYSITYYSISASSSVSGVTVSVSDDEVTSGGSATITISGALPQDVVITDNGTDITSSVSGSGTSHTYSLSNVSADHVIAITVPSSGPTVFLKQNGSWVQAESVFYKQNGTWVNVESIGVKDNGTWKS